MKFVKVIYYITICLLSSSSCNKLDLNWELPKLPEIKTNVISTYTDISATCGGDVTNDGGALIIERGICYSKNPTPTLKDQKVLGGKGKGAFSVNLVSLTPKTTYYLRAFASNKAGTTYGQEVNFTTKGVASISTNLVTAITLNSAQSGGSISSDGGYPITERGICYATTENPLISNTKISSGSGIGNYTVSLTNLTSNTTYFIRAYAVNSSGIAYGSQVSFATSSLPTLTTNQITSISQIAAVTGGNITSSGSSSITERGVCYNTMPNPTIANTKITSGSGLGSFTTNLTGLLAKTTYYVRAYATTNLGTAYGNEITFTTTPIILPSLTTTTPSSITGYTAISGGNVTTDGGSIVSARGICYLTSPNPTISNNLVASGNGLGTFTSNLTGLIPNTTYYIRAYATNTAGTAYGNGIVFTTSAVSIPSLATTTPSSITGYTAISGGNITSEGGSTVSARGICYLTSPNPTISNNVVASGSGAGIFTSNLTGLIPNTTYYVRAYATNIVGTAYGNEVSFTTSLPTVPTVSTAVVTSISSTTAITGGDVTSDGGSPLSIRGVCWSTSLNPTIADSKTNNGIGTGTFTSNLTGLTPNTDYYIRAFATNSMGTAYGSQVTFKTIPAYTVGQSYGGGIIFYIDGTGLHGLIASSVNLTSSSWGCNGSTLVGCNGYSIGTGQSNTSAIVNGCSTTGIAARLCDNLILNGYSDWYLPSQDELNLMYLNRSSIGTFSSGYYWSSSQTSSTLSIVQSFASGTQTNASKSTLYYVRAIRSF